MILFWYIFPFILLLACSFIITTFSLNERWEIKAADIATPFLLIGLHVLSKDMYKCSIVPYMIISILLLGIAIAIGQAYYFDEIDYKRYFKMFWRLIFLFLFIVYLILIVLNVSYYLS